jgi:hypothetical protein
VKAAAAALGETHAGIGPTVTKPPHTIPRDAIEQLAARADRKFGGRVVAEPPIGTVNLNPAFALFRL